MNFEKLEVWKRSCQLSVEVYSAMRSLKDFGFKDQITRSSLSVPSNIAEGMVKPTVKDKIRYLHIANGSCVELRTQVYIGMKIEYISDDVGSCWVQETKELSSMLMGLVKSLQD
ncbi:MAG: four helix bundle protein [Deltaproteobacteria bacterium]|nr:MAG: four helix bundle protein [Deltaproteobacteria bacterium]